MVLYRRSLSGRNEWPDLILNFFLSRFDIPKDQGAAVNSDSRSDNGSVQKGHIYVSTFPHLRIFMSVTSGHVNFMTSPSPVPILGYR